MKKSIQGGNASNRIMLKHMKRLKRHNQFDKNKGYVFDLAQLEKKSSNISERISQAETLLHSVL